MIVFLCLKIPAVFKRFTYKYLVGLKEQMFRFQEVVQLVHSINSHSLRLNFVM